MTVIQFPGADKPKEPATVHNDSTLQWSRDQIKAMMDSKDIPLNGFAFVGRTVEGGAAFQFGLPDGHVYMDKVALIGLIDDLKFRLLHDNYDLADEEEMP